MNKNKACSPTLNPIHTGRCDKLLNLVASSERRKIQCVLFYEILHEVLGVISSHCPVQFHQNASGIDRVPCHRRRDDVKKVKSGWCAPTCFNQEAAAQWSSDNLLVSDDPGLLHRSPCIRYVASPNGESAAISPSSCSDPLCMLSAGEETTTLVSISNDCKLLASYYTAMVKEICCSSQPMYVADGKYIVPWKTDEMEW